VGAALAPNLEVLVGFRAAQGIGTACILPNVMALIAATFNPATRSRALGAWAAMNGAGQSVGPALEAVMAGWAGWRAAFWPIIPMLLIAGLGVWRLVPTDKAIGRRLEWRGASLLTLAALLILGGITAISPLGASSPVVISSTSAGLALSVIFLLHQWGRSDAFLPLWILRDPRYLKSCLTVMAQMFSFAATLVEIPLFLVIDLGITTVQAGVVVLSLPLTMLILAPVAGIVGERFGLWRTLRFGLLLLGGGQCALTLVIAQGSATRTGLISSLVLFGAGVALVQTLAATGATGSAAGKVGSALGLFNRVRLFWSERRLTDSMSA
jgi:MFS family permease